MADRSNTITFSDYLGMTDADIQASIDQNQSMVTYANSMQTTGVSVNASFSIASELMGRASPLAGLAFDVFGNIDPDISQLSDEIARTQGLAEAARQNIQNGTEVLGVRQTSFPFGGYNVTPSTSYSKNYDDNTENDSFASWEAWNGSQGVARPTLEEAMRVTITSAITPPPPGGYNFADPAGGHGPSYDPSRLGPGPAPTPMDLSTGTMSTPDSGGYSVTSPTGYSSRGVNALEGPEAAVGARATSSAGGSSNAGHYAQVSAGNVRSGLPNILDLNGNGIDVSFGTNAAFDYDGDGFREQTAWAAPDDGFLVIDLNADGTRGAGDGVIDQGRELAFAQWGTAGMTDLQALVEARDAAGNLVFDTNGDGVLNASDTTWSEMKVWQDFNQNGVTDAGELQTLESLGISQINLTYDDGTAFEDTANDVSVLGNTLHGLASFVRNGRVVNQMNFTRFYGVPFN